MTRAHLKLLLPGGIVLALVSVLLLAPVLPLPDVRGMDVPNRFAGPSADHWLGQDEFGRDVLARLIWGGRASLFIAVGSALAAAVAGTVLGLLGGYFRGLTEVLTVRAAEILLCLPPLLLALLVVTILGAGTWPLIIALTLLYTPNYARVIYAATLQIRGLDYVTAQRAMGAHPLTILGRTILPNVLPPLLVQMSLVVASAMVIESGLSFLGLGVVPPTPSWGLMIRAARGAMEQAPMLLVWPSLALAGTILTFNLLCDRLQEVLDPREVTRGGALWLRRGARRPAAARQAGSADDAGPVADFRDVAISIRRAPQVTLVHRASLSVMPGETLAIVGESGSGKTLTSLALLGLLPDGLKVSGGEILYRTGDGRVLDLARLDEDGFRGLRGSEVSMIFQDASAALNPVYRIGTQIAETLRAGGMTDGAAISARVTELLRDVGIPEPERRRRAFPHELSGGQRQRVMIAMALANAPRLLVADEPTTALDPTIQAQILDLLAGLKAKAPEMAVIFVTHNLAVARMIADRVCVMQGGRVVETGPVDKVFSAPAHSYTQSLLDAVIEVDPAAPGPQDTATQRQGARA